MLKLDRVNISYGAIQAVREVSLEVPKGQVVTIIGANGAGKSTLLKSVVGLEPLVTGRVFLDGKDVTSIPAHKRTKLGVALSPEGRGVFPDQTVQDNLLLGAYAMKDGASTADRIERSYNMFPRLRERRDQMAGTLSGGEQQMLAIATILLVEQMANQALAVADFAYVLETGRITHQGKGSELLNDERVRAAYLGAH